MTTKLFYVPGTCSLNPHILLREMGADFKLDKVDRNTKKTQAAAQQASNAARVFTEIMGTHEKSILVRQIFEDLAEANFEPKGTKSRGFGKQRIEVGVRKSPASDFG